MTDKTTESSSSKVVNLTRKILIGSTQIGNSANIAIIDDNTWEEDLGHVYVKYYYDKNGKDLIIEWEDRS